MAREEKAPEISTGKKRGEGIYEARTAELCKLLESGGVTITDSAIALGKRCVRK